MGFLEVLTLIFIVLKCFGIISWGWLAVLSPLFIGLIIDVILLIIFLASKEKNMNEYRVYVGMQGGYYTTIEANSLEEALNIAEEEADPFNIIAWDVNVEEDEDGI